MRDLRKWESDGVLTGDLSSWQRSAFTADEVTFSSMEQYMMYKKGRNLLYEKEVPLRILFSQKIYQKEKT